MNETKKLERRDFLKLGASGLAAGALSAGCATVASSQGEKPVSTPAAQPSVPVPAAAPTPAKSAEPPRRMLGRTGIQVPIVSMGVMNADNPNLVRAALDGGIFLLDTAHGYQDGRNEEMLAPSSKTASATPSSWPPRSTSAPWIARPGFSQRRRAARKSGKARHQLKAPGTRSRGHPSPAQPIAARERALPAGLKALEKRPSATEKHVFLAFRRTRMNPK